VQSNPQVIDSPFDESPDLGTITKLTRSEKPLLEDFSGGMRPWWTTETNNSTRARGWVQLEHILLRRKQREKARRKDIENGADHLP
jgi:hypothetical protein